MKKINQMLTVAATIVSITLLLIFSVQYYQLRKSLSQNIQSNPIVSATQTTLLKTKGKTLTLTTAEISKHNTAQDCWFIIDNSVYDITSFIYSHPGGSETLISYCGKDATGAFLTKGGVGSGHSQDAYSLLKNFYIGKVGETVKYLKPQIDVKSLKISENDELGENEWEDD